MKVTAESILSILRKDARNNITAFHRWQTVPGEGAHTVGITLNFHEPYYAGWAPALEMKEVFISVPELEVVCGYPKLLVLQMKISPALPSCGTHSSVFFAYIKKIRWFGWFSRLKT